MRNKYYNLIVGENKAELYVNNDIMTYQQNDSEEPYDLAQEIAALNVEQIDIYIDSYGGMVSEGFKAYNTIKNHPAKVTTYALGFVASAALYFFMAGDERISFSTAAFFFHEVQGGGEEEAEKLTGIGRIAFTENAPVTDEEIAQIQERETWLSPTEMLEMGLATSIISAGKTVSVAQNVRKMVAQALFAKDSSSENQIAKSPAKNKQETKKFFNFRKDDLNNGD